MGEHAKAQTDGERTGPVPSLKKLKANEINTTCLKCHEKANQANYLAACTRAATWPAPTATASTPSSRPGPAEDAADPETCFTCHKSERAKSMRTSHHPVREGKMGCASCHNPHDGSRPKMLQADSVNELCYKCHTEKRGPFLFEHAPVREDCVSCHEPHGSNHKRLLAQKLPNLCWNCHLTGSGHFGSGDNLSTELGARIAPPGAPERLPDGELAVRREGLQELPRESARLQLAFGRLLREVTHEESIERHHAPRHGLPHGGSSRDGAGRAGRLQHRDQQQKHQPAPAPAAAR